MFYSICLLGFAFVAQSRNEVFDQVVGAMSRLRRLVIDHWVRKLSHVARSFPDAWVHQYRRINADDVGAIGHGLPPRVLDVAQ